MSYGALSFEFGDISYHANQELGDSGSPSNTTSVSLSEVIITGLLSGETVTIDVAPNPYYGAGISEPFRVTFDGMMVEALLSVPKARSR